MTKRVAARPALVAAGLRALFLFDFETVALMQDRITTPIDDQQIDCEIRNRVRRCEDLYAERGILALDSDESEPRIDHHDLRGCATSLAHKSQT
jgi:hypothetical protein